MSIASLPRRHPRYTLVLVVALLFCIILQFVSRDSLDIGGRPYPLSPHHKPPPFSAEDRISVEDRIQQSEYYYQQALVERKGLIKKWGPTPEKVVAFPPSDGGFYTLWDFFTPAFQCPHRMRRIGNLGDGGKWVCGMELIERKKNCVIYSVGVNGESSFEAALLERAPGCQVWGYDFSVNEFGPEIEKVPDFKRRAHFKSIMLGGTDAPNDNPPQYTLRKLMAENGHDWIDILKIDIEGGEFESLEALLKSYPDTLPFGQMQIEIHVRENSQWTHFHNFLKWWEKLENAGLRPFWTEPNLVYVNLVRGARPDLSEYSFINLRGSHRLISDDPSH